jgi:hypothetical protein
MGHDVEPDSLWLDGPRETWFRKSTLRRISIREDTLTPDPGGKIQKKALRERCARTHAAEANAR